MNDEYTPDLTPRPEDNAADITSGPAVQPEPAPFAAPDFDPAMLNMDEAPKAEAIQYEEVKQEPVRPAPPAQDVGFDLPPVRPARPGKAADVEPGRKSRYAMMSSWGVFLQVILMSIPGLGILLALIWAVGGCRKIMRRNIARAYFLTILLSVLLLIIGVLVLRFIFPEIFVEVFEYLVPGYTIKLY